MTDDKYCCVHDERLDKENKVLKEENAKLHRELEKPVYQTIKKNLVLEKKCDDQKLEIKRLTDILVHNGYDPRTGKPPLGESPPHFILEEENAWLNKQLIDIRAVLEKNKGVYKGYQGDIPCFHCPLDKKCKTKTMCAAMTDLFKIRDVLRGKKDDTVDEK